ncbi:hypothetical protein LJB78_00695 [Bacteroidales bacterium OttesenSCG-928-J16]|nr:hypothetical protein [Bacteroidales bacterium OttesenSCG-928-J16]
MKIRKTLLAILLLSALNGATIYSLSAQSISTSPYSRFGIGELIPQTNTRSKAMGGISQGLNYSGEINFNNPASYSTFDTLTFLLDFGFTGSFNNMKSFDASSKTTNAYVDYITFGFPIIKRWHTAIGIVPVSSMGYDIYSVHDEGDFEGVEGIGSVQQHFIGNGSFNRVFWGNSFKINKNFSVGINFGYMFGNSRFNRLLHFVDSSYMRTANVANLVYVSDFTFEPGFQYTADLSPKDKIVVGATVMIPKKMSAEKSSLVYSDYDNQGSYVDTILYSKPEKGHIYYPTSLSAGLSYQRANRITVGADFEWSNWAKYESFDVKDTAVLSNCWGIGIGAEILPSDKAAAKYFQRVAYRFGFKTRQQILQFEDKDINEYAVTLGMGLPITRSKTKINLYFEFGRRGTMGSEENKLIRDNYFKIGAGLSLNEMWFYKRQYR